MLRWHLGGVVPNVIVQQGALLHHDEPATVIVYELSPDGSDVTQLTAFMRDMRFRYTYLIVVVGDQPRDLGTIASLRVAKNAENIHEPRWTLHYQEEPGEERCVGAVLVKFSRDDMDNLATAIVPLVANVLRRMFMLITPDEPILDQQEVEWLRSLRTSTYSDPPPSFVERLFVGISNGSQSWAKSSRRPMCIGIAAQSELPWEVITATGAVPEGENRPVVVRVMAGRRKAAPPREAGGNLRAVHVVCPVMGESFSSVDDLDPINGQRGQTALRDFVGSAKGEMRVVSGAKTLDNIARSCNGGIELLHIACHARVNEQEGGRGELWLAMNNSAYAWVPAIDFASALEESLPRVVILEACFSGLGANSVAAELLTVGVSAVVFLQIRPTPEFAAGIIAEFYAHLKNSFMLDHALRATNEMALVVAVSDKSGLDALVPYVPSD